MRSAVSSPACMSSPHPWALPCPRREGDTGARHLGLLGPPRPAVKAKAVSAAVIGVSPARRAWTRPQTDRSCTPSAAVLQRHLCREVLPIYRGRRSARGGAGGMQRAVSVGGGGCDSGQHPRSPALSPHPARHGGDRNLVASSHRRASVQEI